jgi:molecular chaperone HtpG
VSLSDYTGRMKEGQEKIYYLLASSLAAAKSSPHLETFTRKGIEVLLLTDDIDNWLVGSLRDFEGKRLQYVAQGAADLGPLEDEAEAQAKEQASAEFADLVAKLKAILAGQAWDVRVTSRLTTSPACLVANETDADLNPARRLTGTGLPSQPVLEINPQHPLVRRLNRDLADPQLAQWAHLLYNQAVLTLGARIEDPAAFVAKLNSLLVTLTQEPDDPAEPQNPSEPEAAAAEPVEAAAEPVEAASPPPGSDGD